MCRFWYADDEDFNDPDVASCTMRDLAFNFLVRCSSVFALALLSQHVHAPCSGRHSMMYGTGL